MDFIRAIQQNPNDNQLWLVYADWLEDNDDPRSAQVRAAKGRPPVTRRGQTNHLGEREYRTFAAWKKAVQNLFPGATYDGNKDIAHAAFYGMGIGEWDGETGIIYNEFKPPAVFRGH